MSYCVIHEWNTNIIITAVGVYHVLNADANNSPDQGIWHMF